MGIRNKKSERLHMKYKFKTKPYEHQLLALTKSWNKKEYAYFMEMGTGKSKVLIDNISLLYDKGGINAAVIVAPKGVYRNWSEKEIPAHMPDHIEKHIAVWTPSPNVKQKRELTKLFEVRHDLKILIINVEAFSTKRGVAFVEKFILSHNVLIAVDESTTIKNPKAERTKSLLKLAVNSKYRRILTGFPVTQSPLDLYSQSTFLSPDLLGYTSFYSFQNRYAQLVNRKMGARTFRQVVGYQNLEELTTNVGTFSYRVLKKECLDLPDKVYQRREVELTTEQKKVYKELQDYAMAELDSHDLVSVTSVLTQILRLHQVVCGFVKNDEGVEVEVKSNRLDELINILEEVQGKTIIWANYQYDIKRILKTLHNITGVDSVATYYGETPDEERQEIIRRFQDPDSELKYLISNTQTGGYGITLTEASNVIYYSNNYDLEKRLQSEDRAHRIGQTNKVTYIDLVAKGTVDEKIVQALRTKLNLAQEVLGDEKWKDWIG
jgi:SNF2 family DNA or RNA helicase|tara:strand:+ start:5286 stop:6764 length:1479 start_codon:yes stop_codon:yes gene_type:complete